MAYDIISVLHDDCLPTHERRPSERVSEKRLRGAANTYQGKTRMLGSLFGCVRHETAEKLLHVFLGRVLSRRQGPLKRAPHNSRATSNTRRLKQLHTSARVLGHRRHVDLLATFSPANRGSPTPEKRTSTAV